MLGFHMWIWVKLGCVKLAKCGLGWVGSGGGRLD
jgi:hypothetical protein